MPAPEGRGHSKAGPERSGLYPRGGLSLDDLGAGVVPVLVEVGLEGGSQFLGLAVVSGLVLPRVARVEDLRGHFRAAGGHAYPEDRMHGIFHRVQFTMQ